MTTAAPVSLTSRVALAGNRVRAQRSVAGKRVAPRAVSVKAVATEGPATGADGRIYNFSAGPAILPVDVLEEAKEDLLNWKGTGMSVMEMSHRGKEFMGIAAEAESDLRQLVGIPDNYKVLFLQGGASTQFSAIPLNLCKEGDTADFVVTGSWGSKAVSEAKKYINANVAANEKANGFTTIPDVGSWNLTPDAKYVHICSNETIQGVEFKEVPDVGGVPLIADMSSNYLSKPIDVEKYGIIYGGVQKNIGPSGMAIVIVREDLIGNSSPICPTMLDYATMAENDSMYNTPPCYTMYMSGLVFKKLLGMGGLSEVEKMNEAKAKILYDAIDGSDGYYNNAVDKRYRSLMNVPFTLAAGADMEKQFLAEAAKEGLGSLKGHRSIGGARASIYNAMPTAGVEALVGFMADFKARNP